MYTIILTDQFKADVKYYEFKKKFKHIDADIGSIIQDLEKGNLIGNEIPRSAS